MSDTAPFTRKETKSDYDHRIIYAVCGFWSGHSVSVSRTRSILDFKWEDPEVNWPSGGRCEKSEPDDTIAAENFAAAIIDAVKVARKWREEGNNP